MEAITRNVKDIDTADRRAIEHVLGQHLTENQQVVIHVLNLDLHPTEEPSPDTRPPQQAALPDWCDVYEGLSDSEIADIESSIVRSHDSRSFR